MKNAETALARQAEGALARRGAPRPAIRLTRRGRRFAVIAVIAGSLTGATALSQSPSIATDDAPAPRQYSYLVVQPGQTLWEIARGAAPGVDPRVTIGRIRDLNALPGVDIQAGQRLALP